MFFKIDVLKNFADFTRKSLCWSLLLIKLQTFRPATLLKGGLQHRCFAVKFHKFLRALFFREHLQWLFLEGLCKGTSLAKILQSCHFNIFEINHRCFRKMTIKKNGHLGRNRCFNLFLRTPFWRNTSGRLPLYFKVMLVLFKKRSSWNLNVFFYFLFVILL